MYVVLGRKALRTMRRVYLRAGCDGMEIQTTDFKRRISLVLYMELYGSLPQGTCKTAEGSDKTTQPICGGEIPEQPAENSEVFRDFTARDFRCSRIRHDSAGQPG